jgi:sugar lactone lactonase YvrE
MAPTALLRIPRGVVARHTPRVRVARPWRHLLSLLAIGLAGCGSSSTGPNPLTTGAVIVTVQQPAGTTSLAVLSDVTVDYAAFVGGGVDTLIGLTAGTYTLSDPSATARDPFVTPFYAGTISGSPVNVQDADTSLMSVSFKVLPGTGELWVGSENGGHPLAAGYTSVQLTSSQAPGTSLSVGGSYGLFDAISNFWTADSSGTSISEYAAASMGASGTPTPTVTLTSSALNGPIGFVFDRLGDLWVSNVTANTIVEFTASQLAAGGSVAPAVTLSGSALSAPARIAFDAYGNLWVPNAGSNTVVAFAPTQLAASGSPTPAITLSATNASLVGPRAVAFDQQGDLWVANTTGNTIVEFSNGQETASGSPTPALIFAVPSASGAPSALAFDNSGDLWIISATSSGLVQYSAAQISAAVALTPALSFPVASGAASLAFDPPPNGVPLVGPATARRNTGPTPTGAVVRGSRRGR